MELSDLSEITLSVNGKQLTINLEKEFSLAGNDLEKVPVKFGYIVALHYKVLKSMQDKRMEKDAYFATQFTICKTDYEGSRPPSDEAVKQEIMTDEKYLTRLKAYHKAQANFELVTNLLEAYKTRTEILRTLSANRRMEMQSEL
jgi:hypothetical protein